MIMQDKKIIIISASEQLKCFFKLEALSFAFSVECLDKLDRAHNDLSAYDLAIIDVDTVKQMPLNSARLQITVSSQGKMADISYPCAISKVREIYGSLYLQCVSRVDSTESQGVKIVFFNDERNLVSVNERKYILSDAEYKILTALCKSANDVVLREKIQDIFENGKSNIGDVYICRLRKKLEAPLGRRIIFTVRERGYKIAAEAEWR